MPSSFPFIFQSILFFLYSSFHLISSLFSLSPFTFHFLNSFFPLFFLSLSFYLASFHSTHFNFHSLIHSFRSSSLSLYSLSSRLLVILFSFPLISYSILSAFSLFLYHFISSFILPNFPFVNPFFPFFFLFSLFLILVSSTFHSILHFLSFHLYSLTLSVLLSFLSLPHPYLVFILSSISFLLIYIHLLPLWLTPTLPLWHSFSSLPLPCSLPSQQPTTASPEVTAHTRGTHSQL